MEKEEFFELAKKYAENRCNEHERRLFERVYKRLAAANRPVLEAPGKNEVGQRIYNRVKEATGRTIPRKTQLLKWYYAAAGVVLLMACLYVVYTPGFNSLFDKQVTHRTGAGERVKIVLNEGSVIYLNALSTISYPRNFDGDTRPVILQGEAFFEVTKNPSKPFIVHTANVETRVLGTEFNVSAYPGDQITTVNVESGAVQVNLYDSSHQVTRSPLFLAPGEAAVYDHSSARFSKHPGEAMVSGAWRHGMLAFQNEPFSRVLGTVSRWYDQSITFEEPQGIDCAITISFDQMDIEEVLDDLALITGVTYERAPGGDIKILGQACQDKYIHEIK